MDKLIFKAIENEKNRQANNIELIASENFVSKEIMEVTGSILTNKYAEGYPGFRYYGGCDEVDVVENIARERLCKLFNAEHCNVQPHSGSQANMAVYMAVLKPGDTIMGMDLSAGGHLTHGSPVNFSGKLYNIVSYGVDVNTGLLDYDAILKQARLVKPKMIIAGASAYPREIDFKKFREICDDVGCLMMVDMAHIAGLVAAKLHQSPIPYADFVTSTTHKTLRGPRGGVILCKKEYAKVIDKSIFPGIQGGPLMHIIAAKAVCFYEALQPDFVCYMNNVILNCKALSDSLKEEGFDIVTGGSDNHLINVNVKSSIGISGKDAEKYLDEVNITCNKNTVPNETETPFITSGIRLGSAAMTTKGFDKDDFYLVGKLISKTLKNHGNKEVIEEVKKEVLNLTSKYKFY